MRIVIIGGSDAGISAGLRAREVNPGAEVTLVVADEYPNFSICGLPFLFSGEVPDYRNLAHRTLEEIQATGMKVLLGTRAESIDPQAKRVALSGKGAPSHLEYDRLVIATGARPFRPPLPGIDLEGVFVLHDVDHAQALGEHLGHEAQDVVIIGGGYIGLEMADALPKAGHRVTLVERAPQPMPSLDLALGKVLADRMRELGVTLLTNTMVSSIERQSGGLSVQTDDGQRLNTSVVLVVAGVTPNSELGASIGLPTGQRGALRVDPHMGTVLPGVYAAGDCVETWHRLLGRPVWLPLGTTAHKQGRIAGENAAGGDVVYAGTLGTQVVKVFGHVLGRTGLSHADAEREGLDPMTVDFETWDHKAYYPGASRLRVRLTAERATERILGGQILGRAGAEVSKRLDLVAMALHHEMHVDELGSLDLSYTPPLSSPWDPIQMAAQNWSEMRLHSERSNVAAQVDSKGRVSAG